MSRKSSSKPPARSSTTTSSTNKYASLRGSEGTQDTFGLNAVGFIDLGAGKRSGTVLSAETRSIVNRSIGKVRVKICATDGEALVGISFKIFATADKGASEHQIGLGHTNECGYASVNLGHVRDLSITGLFIEISGGPVSETGAADDEPTTDDDTVGREDSASEARMRHQVDITIPHFSTHSLLGIPHDIILPDTVRIGLVPADVSTPSVEDPDAMDLRNCPEAFSFRSELNDGNCCIKPSDETNSKIYYFTQIARLEAPDILSAPYIDNWRFNEASPRPIERSPVSAPIPVDEYGDFGFKSLAANIVQGKILYYRQVWQPVKQSLGDILYSLALAPCEEIKLAVIDWSRRDSARREEDRQASDQLAHDLHRERTIEEAVDAVLKESQSGSTETEQLGGGFSGDFAGQLSIGGSIAQSASTSEGMRSLSSSTVQNLSDSVGQKASSLRSQQITVITTSDQSESDRVQTRMVHNHNKNHAMTVQYYQVLTNYRLATELYDVRDALLIPYQPVD